MYVTRAYTRVSQLYIHNKKVEYAITFWSPSCIFHNRGKQVQVAYWHFLMILKWEVLSQEVHYHNTSMIITLLAHQINEEITLWIYKDLIQHICHHFIKDNCCLDSITLWYVDITLNVYIYTYSGSTLFLYLLGKEPLTNRYMSKHEYMSLSETYLTNLIQTGLCPHIVEILLQQQHITYKGTINTIIYYGCNYIIHIYMIKPIIYLVCLMQIKFVHIWGCQTC